MYYSGVSPNEPRRLRKNANCVLRRAQHERKILVDSTAALFVLRLSKDERMVFPQPTRSG
jgi:hypothetical protein